MTTCPEHGKFGLGAPICPTCALKCSTELQELRAAWPYLVTATLHDERPEEIAASITFNRILGEKT